MGPWEFQSDPWIPGQIYLIWLLALHNLLVLIAPVYCLSALGDLAVDLSYWVLRFYRALAGTERALIPLEALFAKEQKWIGVMIPAWDESDVIRRMIETTFRQFHYDNFHVFVGTYPNDQATNLEVAMAAERYPRAHRVVTPHPGPTCKADCLNWLYQGILNYGKEHGIDFEIVVMHDSEDVVHPLELRMLNYLMPETDFIQIPVWSFERKWHEFTAGTYMDEFAEVQVKNMYTRSGTTGAIPAAGVGCAFTRRACEQIRLHNHNLLFPIDSLTEDYEFGLGMKKFGFRGDILLQHHLTRVEIQSFWSRQPKKVTRRSFCATKEYFPSSLKTSVRQKGRWVYGITIQGWKHLGWSGGFFDLVWFFQDRKALFVNPVGMLGYLVLLAFCFCYLLSAWDPYRFQYPSLVEEGSWLWYLILFDTLMMVNRGFQRAYFVNYIYGARQALLSIPRLAWGNIINFGATFRALRLFANSLITGQVVKWDKTAHVYPSEEVLRPSRRRLGEILLERGLIGAAQLEESLQLQHDSGERLGQVLVRRRIVEERALLGALAEHFEKPVVDIDMRRLSPEALRALPRHLALRHNVLPLAETPKSLTVAVSYRFRPEAIEQIEARVGRKVDFCLATQADLRFHIGMAYAALDFSALHSQTLRIGETLVARGIITEEQLSQALRLQKESFVPTLDVALQRGWLASEALDQLLDAYGSNPANEQVSFESFLVERHAVSREQMELAFDLSRRSVRRLGTLLSELGYTTRAEVEAALQEATDEDRVGAFEHQEVGQS